MILGVQGRMCPIQVGLMQTKLADISHLSVNFTTIEGSPLAKDYNIRFEVHKIINVFVYILYICTRYRVAHDIPSLGYLKLFY